MRDIRQITDIDGLVGHEDFEIMDDTNPGALLVRFHTVAEVMPYLTRMAPDGRTVYKNFVHVRKEWHTGASMSDQRINDVVEYDEANKKWKVISLYPGVGAENLPLSDIRRFTKEWNAFNRKQGDEAIGTPLDVLFGDDPSRIEMYKAARIRVLEQLENASETDLQMLGMGAREDQKRVRRYFEKQREMAPTLTNQAKFEELAATIKHLQNQNADLTQKLTQVLEEQVKGVSPRPRGRPPGQKPVTPSTEGIEGA